VKAPDRVDAPRLLLERPSEADAAEIFERYAGDPEVTVYLGWPMHQTVADTAAFLSFAEQQWRSAGVGPYLIRSREGRLLGATGLQLLDARHAVTGYVLAADSWGRGYATEALTALLGVARSLALAELFALCHPEHRDSQRVLEKCGFARDLDWTGQIEFPNLAPGVLQDVFRYTLVLAGAP
jgi:RimJ/RimL family protein N-acetyltransferase